MKREKFAKILALARKSCDGEQTLAWRKVVEAYRAAGPVEQGALDELIAPDEWHNLLSTRYADEASSVGPDQADCRTCLYADLENQVCRIRAPSSLVSREEIQHGFPNIFSGMDWCGEWRHAGGRLWKRGDANG